MKITVTENKTYAEIMAMPKPKHEKPKKPNIFWRTLLKLVSLPSMIKTGFKCKKVGMEKLGKKALPCRVARLRRQTF